MPIYATDKGSTSVPAPEGTHIARCIQVIDIGSHVFVGSDDERSSRKVRIAWELPTELHTFKEERGPEPFVVSKEFTLSTNEKSNLRQTLESWRGRKFDAEEAKQFDVSVLVGVPALIGVVHDTSKKKGNTYAKITSVTKPPKEMKCPPQVLPSVVYSVDDGKNEAFKALPEWMQEKIAQCDEWKTYPATADQTPAEADVSDDVPF